MEFVVGQEVRIIHNSYSKKGVIACINYDEKLYDVLYNSTHDIEENNIPQTRIHNLESFELPSADTIDKGPDEIKERGNIIFGLQDYETAIQLYLQSLRLLTEKLSISAGTSVLIQSSRSQLDYFPATINYEDDLENMFEVEYDNEDCEECTSRNISEITAVASDLKDHQRDLNMRLLQRSLYINLARCHIKQHQPGWTIKYCSLSIGITKSIQFSSISIENTSLNKFYSDAYFIRGKALIMASRPELARKDSLALDGINSAKAKQLISEIDGLKKSIHKLNRKLVSDLMLWVDSSVTQSAGQTESPEHREQPSSSVEDSEINKSIDSQENDDTSSCIIS